MMSGIPDFQDDPHLAYGMSHISYDADTERHFYHDRDGSVWASQSGNRYGQLSCVSPPKSSPSTYTAPTAHGNHSDDDDNSISNGSYVHRLPSYKEHDADRRSSLLPPPYQKEDDGSTRSRRRRAFTTFDQLDGKMLATSGQGINGEENIAVAALGSLGRRISVRANKYGNGRRHSVQAGYTEPPPTISEQAPREQFSVIRKPVSALSENRQASKDLTTVGMDIVGKIGRKLSVRKNKSSKTFDYDTELLSKDSDVRRSKTSAGKSRPKPWR